MLVLFLLVLLLVVGILLCIASETCDESSYEERQSKNPFVRLKGFLKDWVYDNCDGFCVVGNVVILIAILAILIAGACILQAHTTQHAILAQKQATYEALVFKAESEVVKDDLGLLNKEIIDEIQVWNEDVLFNQKSLDNIWISWFYSPYYRELKTIDLTNFK